MTSWVKSFIWNHSSKVLEYIFAYLLSLLLARELGALEFGVYATIISISTLLISITSLGIDATLTKYTAQYLESDNGLIYLRFINKRLFFLRIITIIISLFLLYILRDYVASLFKNEALASYVIIILFYVLTQSLIQFFVSTLVGALLIKSIFFIGVISRIISLFLAYILLKYNYGISEILWMLVCIYSCAALFYFIFSREFIIGISYKHRISGILKFGLSVWIINFLSFVLGKQADILMLNYFLGKSPEVGYYEAAFSLTQAIGYSFLIGFTGVSLAVFSKLSLSESDKFASAWQIIIKGMQLVMIPVLGFAITFAEDIIPFLYSESFKSSITLFQYFSFLMLISWILGGGLNITALYSLGLQKFVFYSRGISGLLNIILNIILIPKYYALGAIIATGISTIVAISIEFILTKKLIHGKFPLGFFIKMNLVTLFSISCVYAFNSIKDISIVVTFIIYIPIFIIIFIIIKPLDNIELYNLKQILFSSVKK